MRTLFFILFLAILNAGKINGAIADDTNDDIYSIQQTIIQEINNGDYDNQGDNVVPQPVDRQGSCNGGHPSGPPQPPVVEPPSILDDEVDTITKFCFAQTDDILQRNVFPDGTYNLTAIGIEYMDCAANEFITLRGVNEQGHHNYTSKSLSDAVTAILAAFEPLVQRYTTANGDGRLHNGSYTHDPILDRKSALISIRIDNGSVVRFPWNSVFTYSEGNLSGNINITVTNFADGTVLDRSISSETLFYIIGNNVLLLPPGPCVQFKTVDLLRSLENGTIDSFAGNIVSRCRAMGFNGIYQTGLYANITYLSQDHNATVTVLTGLSLDLKSTSRLDTNYTGVGSFNIQFGNRTAIPGKKYATNGDTDPASINIGGNATIFTSVSGNDSIVIPQNGTVLTYVGADGSTFTSSIVIGSAQAGAGDTNTTIPDSERRAQGYDPEAHLDPAGHPYDQTTDTTAPLDAVDRDGWNIFDWRNRNGISHVSTPKDQMGCGSCWDFAATANFEAVNSIAYNLGVVPDDVNPGVSRVNNPNFGAAHPGGLELPTDLSEQQVLDLSNGDCGGSSGEDAIRNVFMKQGGVPRLLEKYPQCKNGTHGFNYGDTFGMFTSSTPSGSGVAYANTVCHWCVVSNGKSGFGSFGYVAGDFSTNKNDMTCLPGSPGHPSAVNSCLPNRLNYIDAGNMLGCSFMSKIGATDTYTHLFTTGIVEDSDSVTAGNLYRDINSPAYNPIAADYWAVNGHQSQNQIRSYLRNRGPLGVYIWAASGSFQGYQKGVFDDPNCNIGVDPNDKGTYGKDLGTDHVVNIVGYGTQLVNQCTQFQTITIRRCYFFGLICFTNTITLPICLTYGLAPMDYWVVKNSWSQYWGEGGYIKIRSGVNACNMENYLFQAVPKKYDVTWQNFWFFQIPFFTPHDVCFNSQNVLLPESDHPSLFKQLKCYSWLCNGNEQGGSPLISWNTSTGSWNSVTPDPAYTPSLLNADHVDNTADPFTETSGNAHHKALNHGYCANNLNRFCKLGHEYCSGASGKFTNNPEDQLRLFADVFGFLFGLPPVGPSSSEQTCAYYRQKCLPHRIAIPRVSINSVVGILGTQLQPNQTRCIDDVVASQINRLDYATTFTTIAGDQSDCTPRAPVVLNATDNTVSLRVIRERVQTCLNPPVDTPPIIIR
jgi:hypothetical protein